MISKSDACLFARVSLCIWVSVYIWVCVCGGGALACACACVSACARKRVTHQHAQNNSHCKSMVKTTLALSRCCSTPRAREPSFAWFVAVCEREWCVGFGIELCVCVCETETEKEREREREREREPERNREKQRETQSDSDERDDTEQAALSLSSGDNTVRAGLSRRLASDILITSESDIASIC